MKVYNGEGQLLGRMATKIAKDVLMGEEVRVVNCDKVVVSGRSVKIFADMKTRQDRRGYPLKSQKRPRMADRFVRRAIRGMLPWKTTRGREAFSRVMCYVGVPAEFASAELVTVENANVSKLTKSKHVTVADIIKSLGGKA